MTKWLRKYNKVLLVVAGVILMVSFLIGPAINQFGPNPAKRTIGYIGPNKARAVTGMDLALAGVELNALRDFVAPLSAGPNGELMLQFLDVRSDVHWLLLVEEAKRAGFIASQDDGAAWIPELAAQAAPLYAREQFIQEFDAQNPGLGNLLRQNPQFLGQINPQRQQELLAQWNSGLALSRFQQSRAQIASSARMTPEQFDTALTKLRGVMRMVLSSMSAPASYSDRRAAAFARDLGDSASIDFLWVHGSRLAADVGEPAQEALDAHFQQYRQTMPGTGEFGLGYLQPPRARIAYLALDAASIAQAVAQTPIPTEHLLDRWSRRRLVYPGEFTAETERLTADLRAERVTDILDLARRTVVQEVHRSTTRLERTGGAYFALPADWTPPDLEGVARAVVAEVQASAGVTIPLPAVTILNGKWQTRIHLQSLAGIGQSQMRQGATAVPFPEVVMAVKELAGENPLGIQLGVPHVEQPLEDSAGNLYFLTVLDVRAIGPADSIDEVIDEVRSDYVALKGFEILQAQGDILRQTAAAQGLDALVALFPPERASTDGSETTAPLTVTRDQRLSALPPQGYPLPLGNEGFCRAVMDSARRLDPRVPAPDQPMDTRTLAASVPEGLGLGIAQVVWFSPFTREQFRGFASNSMIDPTMREWQEHAISDEPESDRSILVRIAMAGFTDEVMRERWNWVEKGN